MKKYKIGLLASTILFSMLVNLGIVAGANDSLYYLSPFHLSSNKNPFNNRLNPLNPLNSVNPLSPYYSSDSSSFPYSDQRSIDEIVDYILSIPQIGYLDDEFTRIEDAIKDGYDMSIYAERVLNVLKTVDNNISKVFVLRLLSHTLCDKDSQGDIFADSREYLIDIFNTSQKDYVMDAAVRVLGKIGGAEVRELFYNAISDSNTPCDVRRRIYLSLISMPDDSSIPMYTELLENNNWPERCIAAQALGELGATEASAVIIEILNKEGNNQTKMAMLEALGLIGNAESVPVIAKFLDDGGGTCTSWPWQKKYFDVGNDVKVGDMAQYAILHMAQERGIDVVPVLIEVLSDENCSKEKSLAIIDLFGQLEDSRVVNVLLGEGITHNDWPVRLRAVQVLGLVAGEEASAAIAEALEKERNNETKMAMLEALGLIGNAESVPVIAKFLDDRERKTDLLGNRYGDNQICDIAQNTIISMNQEALSYLEDFISSGIANKDEIEAARSIVDYLKAAYNTNN